MRSALLALTGFVLTFGVGITSASAADTWITFKGAPTLRENESLFRDWVNDACRPDAFGDIVFLWTQVGFNVRPEVRVFCRRGKGGFGRDWDVREGPYVPRTLTDIYQFLPDHKVVAVNASLRQTHLPRAIDGLYARVIRKSEARSGAPDGKHVKIWLPYWPSRADVSSVIARHAKVPFLELFVGWVNKTCKPDDMGDVAVFFGQRATSPRF